MELLTIHVLEARRTEAVHQNRVGIRPQCRSPYRFWRSGCCFWLIVVAAGCAAPQRSLQPARDPAMLDDTAFLHYLAAVPAVSVDEGLRAILVLAGRSAECRTFDRRCEVLREIGVVGKRWRAQPGQCLDKGTLAYMLRRVCRVPPSLNERVASVTGLGERRYALKTCISEGLLPYGPAHELVTGGEMLSALTNAEEYLASRAARLP